VYTTAPIGRRKVAAIICIPVKAVMAEVPRSMLARANRLLTRHKNMNTVKPVYKDPVDKDT
jgi:hypothetical protein